MNIPIRHWALSLSAALLLAACGGGDNGASDDWHGSPNLSAPTANAGAAQSVLVGTQVRLNGSASQGGGESLNYQWLLVSKPDGSQAVLTDADSATPYFVADLPGRYELDLVVRNSAGASNHSRVLITAGNTEPIADGPSTTISALVNGWAQLDGSRSTPPAGGDTQAMNYLWTVTAPDGSAVQLYDSSSDRPGFVPTQAGLYLAQLVVNYGRKNSEPFVISINVTRADAQPIAQAGGPYRGVTGQPIQLDGAASKDLNDKTLSYAWRLSPYIGNLPATAYANVKLEGANTATPSFSADIAGNYNLDLYVFNGTSRSQAARATVTLGKPEGAPDRAPVAVIRDYYPLNEAEVLSASSTAAAYIYFFSDAYDMDGRGLTYKWEWGNTPAGFSRPDLSSYSNRPTVTIRPTTTGAAGGAPVEGYYTMHLTVNNGVADSPRVSQTVHVRTGANRRPAAVVKADTSSVMIGTEAWFDGTGSSDPDDGTHGMTYAWRWAQRPDGSNAVLRHANAARASFVPDVAGAYEAELIVYDSTGTPSRASEWTDYPKTATVMAKQTNHPPVARFIDAKPATLDAADGTYRYTLLSQRGQQNGLSCNFNNLAATTLGWVHQRQAGEVENLQITAAALDPDGDELYYHLAVQQPAGSQLQSSYSGKVEGSQVALKICNLDLPGDYTFTLQVSDGSALTDVQRLIVRVQPAAADATALKLETLQTNQGTSYEETVGEQDPTQFNTLYRLDQRQQALRLGYNAVDMKGQKQLYETFQHGGVVKYLRLTAVGQDFVLRDVETSTQKFFPREGAEAARYSTDFESAANHQPRIEGLPERIRAGQSVVFKLILPPMPAPREQKPAFWETDRNFDIYDFRFAFSVDGAAQPVQYSLQTYVPLRNWNWNQ